MEIVKLFLTDLSWVLIVVSLVIAGLLLLRMIVHWMNLSPFSWLPYNLRRITEPMLRPLRETTGRILPFDLVPLVMAVFVVTTGFFAAGIFNSLAFYLPELIQKSHSPREYAILLIQLLVFIYTILIFLRIIFLMFRISYYGRFARFTFHLTEPLLRPLRRHLIIGMFDLSPLVAILIVQVVGWILISMLNSFH